MALAALLCKMPLFYSVASKRPKAFLEDPDFERLIIFQYPAERFVYWKKLPTSLPIDCPSRDFP